MAVRDWFCRVLGFRGVIERTEVMPFKKCLPISDTLLFKLDGNLIWKRKACL